MSLWLPSSHSGSLNRRISIDWKKICIHVCYQPTINWISCHKIMIVRCTTANIRVIIDVSRSFNPGKTFRAHRIFYAMDSLKIFCRVFSRKAIRTPLKSRVFSNLRQRKWILGILICYTFVLRKKKDLLSNGRRQLKVNVPALSLNECEKIEVKTHQMVGREKIFLIVSS